jgi:hypothetical protein
MNMSDIVRKIQMLLRKTPENGATEAESHNAILMAQKLMAQHKLTDDDVKEREYSSPEAELFRKEAFHRPVTNYMKLEQYHWRVGKIIAENFRCFSYTEADWTVSKSVKRVVFLGLKDDTEIAFDVYKFAIKSIEHLSKQYANDNSTFMDNASTKLKIKNDYMEGFMRGLKSKFEEQVKSNNFQLALVKDEIVVAEHNKMEFTNRKARGLSSAGGDTGRAARKAGYEAGKSLNYGAKQLK